MKKGKTIPTTAIAVALLSTTMLVAPSEAEARRYDGISYSTSQVQRPGAKRQRPAYTQRAKARRAGVRQNRYANRNAYRSARYGNRQRVARQATGSATRTAVQRPADCGAFDLRINCTGESNNASYQVASREPVSVGSFSSWTRSHMAAAQSMIGMTARGNRGQLRQIFASTLWKPVDPARTPWCAAWANAVLAKSGIKGTGSLLARSFLNWGTPTRDPAVGDVAVLGRGRISGHVGFVVERKVINGKRYVKLLGGNQGRSVKHSWFPESRVLGYRRPA